MLYILSINFGNWNLTYIPKIDFLELECVGLFQKLELYRFNWNLTALGRLELFNYQYPTTVTGISGITQKLLIIIIQGSREIWSQGQV